MAAGPLVVPTPCGEKFCRAGYSMRKEPLTPLPFRGIATTLFRSLSVIVMAPDCWPVAVGEKVAVIVQSAPTARLAPQLLVWAKLPLATMLAMLNCTLLGLLNVMVCGRLVVPVPWEAKFSEPGEIDLNGALSITAITLLSSSTAAQSGTPSPLKSPTVSPPTDTATG